MEHFLKNIVENYQAKNINRQRPTCLFVEVPKNMLEATLFYLKSHGGFKHLAFITAVDWLENNQFQLTYMLWNAELKFDLGIYVLIDRNEACMFSIHHLWATAWSYQRELKEMYGINFPNSPRVDEDFLLEGWVDMPPMRRDFDTKAYSDKEFNHRPRHASIDPKQHMQNKLFPKREANKSV